MERERARAQARARRRRSRIRKVLAAFVVLGFAGGAAFLVLRGGNRSGSTSVTAARPPAPPHHHARYRARPSAAELRLQRELSAAMAPAGGQSGAAVYDLTTHTPLFSLRAGTRRPPASVEKLYTTVALLSRLGAEARLHTAILGTGHLGPGGVWHGDLYLRGGGDPTFGDDTFHRIYEGGAGASATELARALAAKGIRRVDGQLIGDASRFDDARGGPATRLGVDIPDFGGQLSALVFDHGATQAPLSPGAFAAKQMALTLRTVGIQVVPSATTARTPRRAQRLALVASPSLPALLRLMNVPSDDLFAEMLTKQLGARFGAGGSIAAGAGVIQREVDGMGLHPRIRDGSGLSRDDSSSPAEVVKLLRLTWHTPTGQVLMASLPLTAVNGTVRRIGVHTGAQGRCVAKTGTLNNVTNLAGYCNASRGHKLAFAVFLDGPSNEQALPLLSRVIDAIAHYP